MAGIVLETRRSEEILLENFSAVYGNNEGSAQPGAHGLNQDLLFDRSRSDLLTTC